ncbi:adenylate/guanylate cyclase domain-containing protein [Tardiphaga sp. 20_F10_N6_6]|jgi:class 3 adenylate cyclase|uniref:Adenylate/guanylate cyclase domain-containing protein n=1 Tax=Tardiphaga robiniae TaxID=943830 RepID=A0A7G6U566_9BRAD|nr:MULTISPECIES: adenylate/guanylate cyclase domain-containing protein [Tardiphaga]MDR6657810.1 class 3 adenylate cyclase [Tardiphaga robiniae]QND74148.1 adenylate/guanylate cyclase domain-containing protein [Tardiphaga robiniae]UFS75031.1 adenylate/guanylate cyclase domain-containing protein [Tardiphaga sp. 37S4]WPO42507.1 adenylate/guanylate cyclase domain-containing protein [Tardiphaga sp. 42S5]SEH83855.1 Adenylate cyclase, class 3 [Tardiphaga sp. OK245]
MSDVQALFATLNQATDPAVADAIAQLIRDGADHELNRINVLDFAARRGLNEERVISGFLHASRLGLFDLTWNVLCPGCSGVLDAHSTLKSLRHDDYHCGLCACGYEASVDEQVEVAFTVAPRVRHIAAHDPNTLPLWEYFKQVFWSSGVDLNQESFASLTDEVTLDAMELPAHEKAVMSLHLPSEFVIVFEPVTHAAQFIDVQGEPTKERQHLSLIYNRQHTPTGTITLQPGPLRLSLENQTEVRVLPSVFVAAEGLHHLIGKRKPFLTAKRILTNQTFRDVYKADNLNIDQRLKITSLTFLFTDLKGSTALYERVGDLAAFDLVRAHFHALLEIIASEAGAVVKTIGDAVMATFTRPEQALAAGLRMRAAMERLNEERGTKDLVVKIGIHEGPCLAVMLNERQDYFGQTVNIAARVQGLSTSQAIHVTSPVISALAVEAILRKAEITPIQKHAALRGIADKIVVYEIP